MSFQPANLENHELLGDVLKARELSRTEPSAIHPWLLPPCRVRTLLVTDGGLDFSGGVLGLSTFIWTLVNDDRDYVKFDLTLAHLRTTVSDAEMAVGRPGIVRRITNFRFDNSDHFTPTMYDQVWLFGYDDNYHSGAYRDRSANSDVYPADRLSDGELVNLSTFMNRGGGLFATGDHGQIGRSLCSAVPRARSMRVWTSTDEVSMSGPRRNDTNRIGHDMQTQFDDQSDDIPQEIQPKLYSAWVSPFFRLRWPHPLLCGPRGTIRVLPDHPHEGECVVPTDLGKVYAPDRTREYPDATDGFGPVVPEIIARSTVPTGNTASLPCTPQVVKQPTIGHSFGAISAYDGHRAGVGRVVCDATWHHFVNVNLIGDPRHTTDPAKHWGFLTPAGEKHLDAIKAYHRNIAVWISPLASQRCFRRKMLWSLLYQHRVMEAVLSTPDVPLDGADAALMFEIGAHARDVLATTAGRCVSLQWLLDLLAAELGPMPEFDPWLPEPKDRSCPIPPFVDPAPVIDMALGGALLALRDRFPVPSVDLGNEVDKIGEDIIAKGASVGARTGLDSFGGALEQYLKLRG